MTRQEAMERAARRVIAWVVLLIIATACGLDPFDHATLFWVGVLSIWVLR